jgi:branched-chain amino acid transport system ATP-binding protein
MVLLSIQNVSKNFGGLQAIMDLSFDIEKGQIVGLIGPNGSGKTTLVNIISGIEKADGGRILFNGEDITKVPAHMVAKKKILRTFQIVKLCEESSVVENIMLGSHPWTKAEIIDIWLRRSFVNLEERKGYQYSIEILKLLGLEHVASLPSKMLSPGERQLVQMGRVLVAEPELVLLDEPVGGLTGEEKVRLQKLLLEKRKEGLTILLIGHDMHFVMETCERIVVLNFGKKIAEGNPVEVVKDLQVIDAYLGGGTGDVKS